MRFSNNAIIQHSGKVGGVHSTTLLRAHWKWQPGHVQ